MPYEDDDGGGGGSDDVIAMINIGLKYCRWEK